MPVSYTHLDVYKRQVLGIAETLGAGYISSAYEDVFAFGLLVLILILRPAGLLGKAVKQKV